MQAPSQKPCSNPDQNQPLSGCSEDEEVIYSDPEDDQFLYSDPDEEPELGHITDDQKESLTQAPSQEPYSNDSDQLPSGRSEDEDIIYSDPEDEQFLYSDPDEERELDHPSSTDEEEEGPDNAADQGLEDVNRSDIEKQREIEEVYERLERFSANFPDRDEHNRRLFLEQRLQARDANLSSWNSMRWEDFSSQELEAIRAIERRLVEGCSIGIQPPGADALEVPLQREYKGNNPALPSLLADAPCSRFSAEQLLLILNSLLYTAYPLVNPLSDLLQHYISQTEIDFGTLYSRLRLVWTKQDFDNYEEKRLQTEDEVRACRQSLSQGGVIIQPKVPPRRMWDLFSNRVIDASLVSNHWPGARREECEPGKEIHCLPNVRWVQIYAISHSWMAVDQRHDILTPINHFEWRVPFPCDSSLERVRVELLNMGAEYAWLDVLCLRQFDQEVPGEVLRQEEWKMDVPTIGRVYEETHHVVHYFSGLGRPFAIGDLTSDRHWLNRAWTLQEVGLGGFRVTAGLTDDSPQDPWEIEDKISGSGPFYDRLAAMDDIDGDSPQALLNALLSMRIRDCSSPLDRVAGLAYPLGVRRLPTYDYKNWDPEKAWNELLLVMEPKAIMMLSMASAFQGSGNYKFLPSWRQIMESNDWHRITNPICARVLRQLGNMHQQDGRFYARVSLILDCRLTGLGSGSADGTLKGKVSMKTHSGELMERGCNAVTSIPDGVYHFLAFVDLDDVGRTGWKSSAVETFNWIVGIGRNAAQFEKVGVVELCDLYCPLDWEEVVRDTVVEML